mmetsp:Transcript_59326/g.129954  ORF Transcript_59326/g.129954 Transcript_59326/m.129954 type:complete len:246 (-) Transcript_59326:448-1185(-)
MDDGSWITSGRSPRHNGVHQHLNGVLVEGKPGSFQKVLMLGVPHVVGGNQQPAGVSGYNDGSRQGDVNNAFSATLAAQGLGNGVYVDSHAVRHGDHTTHRRKNNLAIFAIADVHRLHRRSDTDGGMDAPMDVQGGQVPDYIPLQHDQMPGRAIHDQASEGRRRLGDGLLGFPTRVQLVIPCQVALDPLGHLVNCDPLLQIGIWMALLASVSDTHLGRCSGFTGSEQHVQKLQALPGHHCGIRASA